MALTAEQEQEQLLLQTEQDGGDQDIKHLGKRQGEENILGEGME